MSLLLTTTTTATRTKRRGKGRGQRPTQRGIDGLRIHTLLFRIFAPVWLYTNNYQKSSSSKSRLRWYWAHIRDAIGECVACATHHDGRLLRARLRLRIFELSGSSGDVGCLLHGLTCSSSSISCVSLTFPRSWPVCAIRTSMASIWRDLSGLTNPIRDTSSTLDDVQSMI